MTRIFLRASSGLDQEAQVDCYGESNSLHIILVHDKIFYFVWIN